MADYLGEILKSQRQENGRDGAEAVLEKLRQNETALQSEDETRREQGWEPASGGEPLRGESTQTGSDLTELSLQISRALEPGYSAGGERNADQQEHTSEETFTWGVIPVTKRENTATGTGVISMEALSKYYERDARRYPG